MLLSQALAPLTKSTAKVYEGDGRVMHYRVAVSRALGSDGPKLKSTFCATLSNLLNLSETVFSSENITKAYLRAAIG